MAAFDRFVNRGAALPAGGSDEPADAAPAVAEAADAAGAPPDWDA
jgi:hypothetical protein